MKMHYTLDCLNKKRQLQLYDLGNIYLRDLEMPDKGTRYYNEAFNLDNIHIINAIARKYLWGYGRLDEDHVKARESYERSIAIKPNPDAYANLARIYRAGLGVPANPTQAILFSIQEYLVSEDNRPAKLANDVKLAVQENPDQFVIEYIGLLKRIEELERQIYYQPEGPGYLQAKEDFQRLTNNKD